MKRSIRKEIRRATDLAPTHTWTCCKIASLVCSACGLRITKSQRMFYTFGGGTADVALTCDEQQAVNAVQYVQES